MEKDIYSRQKLYDLVWSEPLTKIAMKYGLSVNGLRNICVKMNIPLPKRGYWQKLKFDKNPARTKLPSSFTGDIDISLNIDKEGSFKELSPVDHLNKKTKEIEGNSKLPLTVPKRLINPHKLVIEAQNVLRERSASEYGYYTGVVESNWEFLKIRVAPSNVGRALQFMNALIKLLHARQHEIKCDYDKTLAIINGEELQISYMEQLKRVKEKEGSDYSKLIPTGILTFRVRRGWSEPKIFSDLKVPLENQLAKILAYLEIEAQKEKDKRKEIEENNKEWEKEKRIEREIKERKEKEIEEFKDLIKQSNQWHQANIIRNYIKAIKENAGDNLNENLATWVEWAEKKIDWYDPLINTEDGLVDDENIKIAK